MHTSLQEKLDELEQAIARVRADDPECEAYIRGAIYELETLRSDIISELGNTTADLFLKTRFTSGVNAALLGLRRALR